MHRSRQEHDHPAENMLLRYLDGELDANKSAALRQHLEACWRCRTETDELQSAIRDYMQFHKHRIIPLIPNPPRHWHRFDGLLRQAERESAVPGWKKQFLALRSMPLRTAWIGGAVACMLSLLVFLGTKPNGLGIASATEILHRATLNEASARPNQARRVRVRFQGRAFVRNVGNIQSTDSSNQDGLEPLFRLSSLDWRDPLSARAFANWHNTLRRKSDHVRLGADRIAVDTSTDEGQLRQASFVVRAADYHPIEESLDFGTSGRVEVIELPNVPEVIAATPPAHPRTSKPRPAAPSSTPDDIEAQARFLLHAMGADLNELLSIRQTGDEIEVTGVVSAADREQEIRDRIGALDHVVVRIQSAEELALQTPSQPVTQLGESGSQNYDAPAKAWLEREFPDALNREVFVHRTLELTRGLSVRGYAVSQLAARYPETAFDSLSPGAKAQIGSIVTDLADGIDEYAEALRLHLKPLVVASRVEPPGRSWQSAAAQCLTSMREVDGTVIALFAASPQPAGEFNSLVARLRPQLSNVCRIRVD